MLTLFLAGDVMTGRGIDQVLPHSVDPRIYERYAQSARGYVELAERLNGEIPNGVSYSYIWGDALEVLQEMNPDTSIINLETSVTTSENYWKSKNIHYRMHPGNTPLLTEAGIDICVLGNNHVLDWGYRGLEETIDSLRASGIKTAGAGADRELAAKPAVVESESGSGRLLVFSYAFPSAGAAVSWRAEKEQAGVNILSAVNTGAAEKVASDIRQYRREGDRVILSLHWGGNWGYNIPKAHQNFAHRIIDEEIADVIFGHSSHHPKGMEVYNGRLILYGCGDLINDYEGISGHEEYRPDLRLMYFPQLDEDGTLLSLRMAPMQMRRFQLRDTSKKEKQWLRERLDRECNSFGHSVELTSDGYLALQWE
jgi:poly-gamma-glutamate synthesis protein (capsule biosynthesis protein)